MVTHLQIEMNGQRYLNFQPRGLNPETGLPMKRMWVVETRISGGEIVDEPNLPINVLGTEVEDEASGFKGTATAIQLHISGCVHVSVQPSGKLPKTGETIDACDFDIRRLKGDAIPKMSEPQRDKDQAEKPSPANSERYQPRAC